MFDEMRICTSFMRGIVSKVISRTLKKRTGCDVAVQLNNLGITLKDGKTHVHLDIDAELDQEELMKLISIIGLK